MTKRYPVRLYIHRRDHDNRYMLTNGNDERLASEVDCQISLDELVHTTLADWILIDNLAWCYPLFECN